MGTKAVSPTGKHLIFESVIKVRVIVGVCVSLQKMNVSLCNVPKSDLGQGTCVYVRLLSWDNRTFFSFIMDFTVADFSPKCTSKEMKTNRESLSRTGCGCVWL